MSTTNASSGASASTVSSSQADIDFMDQLFGTGAHAPSMNTNTPAPPSGVSTGRPASARVRASTASRQTSHPTAAGAATKGRAGSRIARPQSARPTTTAGSPTTSPSSLPTTTRTPSRFASTLSSFVPTPSHLHRLKLHQSLALQTPQLEDYASAGEPEQQLSAALLELKKKMSLLEGERRSIAEKHAWEVSQNTSMLTKLQSENKELQLKMVEHKEQMYSEAKAEVEARKRELKAQDPIAMATRLRAQATSGSSLQSLQKDSLLSRVGHATRSFSSALTTSLYDPNASIGITLPAGKVAPTVSATAMDPLHALKLRKAYDLLRHTADVKQKQYDALANEMDMMILKVKSSNSSNSNKSSSNDHHHHLHGDSSGIMGLRETDPAQRRKAGSSISNPVLAQVVELQQRLDTLMSQHNQAIREGSEYSSLLDRLQSDHACLPTTLQMLEQQLRAREVEYENCVNFFSHARDTSETVSHERDALVKRLDGETVHRRTELDDRSKQVESLKQFFAENALRDRERIALQGLKSGEEKTGDGQRTVAGSRTMSRVPSNAPPLTPLAILPPSTPSSHHNNAPTPSHGKSTPSPSLRSISGNMSHIPPTALIPAARSSSTASSSQAAAPVDPNETFLAQLNPFQQKLCRAFLLLERKYAAANPAKTSPQLHPPPPSIMDPAYGVKLKAWQAATGQNGVDVNLLLADVLDKLQTQSKLQTLVAKYQAQIQQLKNHTWVDLRKELDAIQYNRTLAPPSSDHAPSTAPILDVDGRPSHQRASSLSSAAVSTGDFDLLEEARQAELENQLNALHASNESRVAEAEQYVKKTARIDKILVGLRAGIRHLMERLQTLSPDAVGDLSSLASPTNASSALVKAGDATTSAASGTASAPALLPPSVSSLSVDPLQAALRGAAGESSGSGSGILESLSAYYSRMSDIIASIPLHAYPAHLSSIPANIASNLTHPLWPSQLLPGAASAAATAAATSMESELGALLLSGTQARENAIAEGEEEEEEEFPVHRSPQSGGGEATTPISALLDEDEEGGDDDLKRLLNDASAAAAVAASSTSSKHKSTHLKVGTSASSERPHSAF